MCTHTFLKCLDRFQSKCQLFKYCSNKINSLSEKKKSGFSMKDETYTAVLKSTHTHKIQYNFI